MDKTFHGLNRVTTQMEYSPTPAESCIANSLLLRQSKVVNPPPYPGGTLEVSLDSSIMYMNDLPLAVNNAEINMYADDIVQSI